MKKSLLLFALLVSAGGVQTVQAQSMKAKGKVVDEKHEGIPGAAVKVEGSTQGTMTDVDGNFEIDLPDGGSKKVIISAMGKEDKTVTASENMDVTLTENANVLVDVTITQPYGPKIAKQAFVGAADVITEKQIERMPVSDITRAIEGASPGLQVTNGGGQPGSGAGLQLRGTGSLSASTSPLIVVDGAPYFADITSINPNDVASMTVLKDAMATSIYGSRGSNGVIIITTKRGKPGEKPRITVDGKMGTVTRGLPMYNVMTTAKDYYETSWRGLYNKLITAGETPQKAGTDASGYTSSGVVDLLGYNSYNIPGVDATLQNAFLLDSVTGKLNPNAVLKYQDDWQKALQRTGLRQDYNFNISGATDKSDYFLSAGYLNEKGYIINSDYSRFTTRLNLNTQATNWLKVGLNASASMSTQNNASSDGSANSGNPSYMAMTMAPVFPVYWRDSANNKVIDPATGKYKLDYGAPSTDPNFSMGQRPSLGGTNIVGQLESDENRTYTKNFVVVPYLEAKFLKNFTFNTTLNATYSNYNIVNYTNSTHGTGIDKGYLYKAYENDFTYNWKQMLTYEKTFNEAHNIAVTAVHENYYMNTNYMSSNVSGFPNDAFREFPVANGTPSVNSQTDNERTESYLAIANYDYKGKYLLQANIRRDGLSRFYEDSRWGTFGGFGAGWVVNQENFMKDVTWIDRLKLKASIGTTGNNLLISNGAQNYYAWQGLYDLSRPNGGYTAAIPYTLINTNLKWESQLSENVGVEFQLFKGIVSGEVNVYNRNTSNLYYNIPLAPSLAIANYTANVGEMNNRGLELNFYVTPVKTKNFTWTFNTNWSKNKNKITKLAPGIDSLVSGYNLLKPGYNINSFYLVHSAGVDKTNGDELYSYTDAQGNVRDTNNYTYANSVGRKIVGNSTPSFQGAFTNTFRYKGFELTFMVTYGVGGKYYDATYQSLMGSQASIGGSNYSKDLLNSWTPENTSATLPRFELNSPNIAMASDRFLISASYLNFRNINLRYTLPSQLVSKAGFNSLSAYISGDNLGFISARKGMNPQGSFSGQLTGGNAYPYNPARTIMVGLTLGL